MTTIEQTTAPEADGASHGSPRPALAGLQLLAAVVDGVALSTIVLHVTAHLALRPGTTGLVLAAAATAALVLAGPLGAIADRVGPGRAGVVATTASGLALLGYAVADSLTAYAISAVTFVVAQAVSGSIRQALAVTGVAAPDRIRVRVRATMHTLLNAGMGAGTVLGAGLAVVGTGEAFRGAYLVAGTASLGGAIVLRRLSRSTASVRAATAPTTSAGLRLVAGDHRFVLATALTAVVQLTMPILSVLLPVWVLQQTGAPAWTAGAALALNTGLVLLTQRAVAARLLDVPSVVTAARVAGAALLLAAVLMAVSGAVAGPLAAGLLLTVAVLALTCGEVVGGAATWAVALGRVPSAAETSYQSVFSMSASGARILGPAVALPLVLAFPTGGWVALGLAMGLACLSLARMALTTPTAPTAERTDAASQSRPRD